MWPAGHQLNDPVLPCTYTKTFSFNKYWPMPNLFEDQISNKDSQLNNDMICLLSFFWLYVCDKDKYYWAQSQSSHMSVPRHLTFCQPAAIWKPQGHGHATCFILPSQSWQLMALLHPTVQKAICTFIFFCLCRDWSPATAAATPHNNRTVEACGW